MILIRLIYELVGLDIAVEIIGYEVVIAMLNDGIAESSKAACVAETVALDGFEYFFEIRVELELPVCVCVTEVFDIFR